MEVGSSAPCCQHACDVVGVKDDINMGIVKFINSLCYAINRRVRDRRVLNMRKNLRNSDFSLITENCLGGFIYHDLNRAFLSPVINGEFSTEDYLKFLWRFGHYLEFDLEQITDAKDSHIPEFYKQKDVPIGVLDDIYFRFTHYSLSEKDKAQEDWNRRRRRVNMNNLFVVMVEKAGVTKQQMEEFNQLPYKNKIILTHKKYSDIPNSYYIRGFEKKGYIGVISDYMSGLMGKRYYDQFDWVSWLNGQSNG